MTRNKSNRRKRERHGLTGTPIYSRWQGMIRRCYNPSRNNYHLYGGRGITVCDRWLESLAAFHADMGDPPTPKHSLDRIDNSLGYFPGNCQWSNPTEQANNTKRNRILVLNGVSDTASAWAESMGLHVDVIYGRLRLGWTIERTLTQPLRSKAKSLVPGVGKASRGGKYEAEISRNGQRKHLGTFSDWFEAVCARKSAEVKL